MADLKMRPRFAVPVQCDVETLVQAGYRVARDRAPAPRGPAARAIRN